MRSTSAQVSRDGEAVDSRAYSPEVRTLCPQPRRALQLIPSTPPQRGTDPGSPYPSSPEWASMELRELMTYNCAKSYSQAASPAISQASTSAGPTPIPDEAFGAIRYNGAGDYGQRNAFVSHGGQGVRNTASPDAWSGAVTASPNHVDSQARSAMSPVSEEAPWKVHEQQSDCKIFVGGIPQDMKQEELQFFFESMCGNVKKSWIQNHRSDNNTMSMCPHRGFGFVIFREMRSIEQLLGNDFARFISMPNGRRLEVKRAVCSSKLDYAGKGSGKGLQDSDYSPTLAVRDQNLGKGNGKGKGFNKGIQSARPQHALEPPRLHTGHVVPRPETPSLCDHATTPMTMLPLRGGCPSAVPGSGSLALTASGDGLLPLSFPPSAGGPAAAANQELARYFERTGVAFPSTIEAPPEIMGRTAQELECLLKQAMPEIYDD